MEKVANAEMLVLGRESRGMSQARLADAAGVSQGVVSKAENGLLTVSGDRLAALAKAMSYPVDFFDQDERLVGVEALFHRRLRSVKSSELRQIQAQINVRRVQVKRLMHGIAVETPYTFPRLDVDEVGGPERVAQLVRRSWRLPFGPVANVVESIEAAGGVVTPITLSTEKVSAAAQWPPGDERPYFFVNDQHSGDRQRFSLAHEIGHIVMHGYPEEEQEDQADRFASEFLMPEPEIRPQLKGRLTMPRLIELKRYWKVSIAALIRRAGQLGVLTKERVTSLYKMLSARGWRKVEPAPIAQEQPQLLRIVFLTHARDHGYTPSDLSKVAMVSRSEFDRLYSVESPSDGSRRRRLHAV